LDEEKRITNEITGGQKGVKQARFDLIPAKPLWEVARVYGYGADKYAHRNWEKGYDWGLSYGALQRHLHQFWMGEFEDEESGLPHLAHAMFHCLALMQYHEHYPQFDDRSKLNVK
jgi:hypothetical protein